MCATVEIQMYRRGPDHAREEGHKQDKGAQSMGGVRNVAREAKAEEVRKERRLFVDARITEGTRTQRKAWKEGGFGPKRPRKEEKESGLHDAEDATLHEWRDDRREWTCRDMPGHVEVYGQKEGGANKWEIFVDDLIGSRVPLLVKWREHNEREDG
ncbi:hypothetical protein DFH06DRAFT_1134143 [Mycena polygramma]|nr:hypothetical protein DFH06DRAFT_1134143 [Mycena polygramma]